MAAKNSLANKMAAAAASAAPSMVPAEVAPTPPPAKEEPKVPDLKDLVKDKRTYLELKRLIVESIELQKQESDAKKLRKPITNRLKDLLGKYGIDKAQEGEARINYFSSPRSTIKAARLLERGISPEIIQACTETKLSSVLKITVGNDEDENSD